jgi:beta-lactamase superfamily II metal-dependent hydrolase
LQTLLSDPPSPDVLEVSIFGPGKGECILVHLGEGKWIVVDSCRDQASKSLPALEYLSRINVNVSTDVLLVVGTHAHDDHIAGISSILSACESALFVCSAALTREEFVALTAREESSGRILRWSSYSEYVRIFDLLEERKSRSRPKPLRFALANRELISLTLDSVGSVRILSLSPSDTALERSLQAFSVELRNGSSTVRSSVLDPNELSIALWLEVGEKRILLGADLLNGPSGCGWGAVLDGFVPGSRRASVFKVPHHGAPNAHHEKVWETLLVDEPIALLAPYRAGRNPRPAAEDRTRIKLLTPYSYITASMDLPAQSKAARKDAGLLQSIAKEVREPWGRAGHVRARSSAGSHEWNVELAHPAREL